MPNNLTEPETRKEMFLASAAGMPVETPEPLTREEMYLDAIAKGGGVSPDDAYTKAQTDALLAQKADAASVYSRSETNSLVASKADLSILTPMTQEEYDAIVTKTAPLYFIYEDGESS